jgi:NAD(P)-dependent dehydrogenase (short-subunit alcohol dehydrogenase family)
MDEFPENGGALVTGGSGGIGAAVARMLGARGVTVAVAYNSNAEAAAKTVAAVAAAGGQGHPVQMDLRDEAAVRAAVDGAAAEMGGLHTLISAHGPFIHMQHISKMEPALFRETMEADTFAVFNLVHAALPHLREARGSLVAIATPAIQRYAVKDLLSVAPKAAVEAIVRGVAAEEGRFGIRANTVGVGVITDGMFQALVDDGAFDERFLEASRQNMALRRLGTAEEVAEAVVFLASNRARWITGQQLNVDGGYAV